LDEGVTAGGTKGEEDAKHGHLCGGLRDEHDSAEADGDGDPAVEADMFFEKKVGGNGDDKGGGEEQDCGVGHGEFVHRAEGEDHRDVTDNDAGGEGDGLGDFEQVFAFLDEDVEKEGYGGDDIAVEDDFDDVMAFDHHFAENLHEGEQEEGDAYGCNAEEDFVFLWVCHWGEYTAEGFGVKAGISALFWAA